MNIYKITRESQGSKKFWYLQGKNNLARFIHSLVCAGYDEKTYYDGITTSQSWTRIMGVCSILISFDIEQIETVRTIKSAEI